MERIDIGISRAHMLDLLSAARAEFEKPDVTANGTAEYVFEARTNDRALERVEIRFSNDDMEREDITSQVYVEVS